MNKIETKKYELLQSFPMTWELVLSGASEDKIFKTVHHEIAEMELERRSRDTLKERFAKIDETNEYRLCDLVHSGDKILIKTTPNVISSSIVLEYTNTKYDVEAEILSIKNLIKELNLQKESLEKEKNTIITHMERLDNEQKD